MPDQPNIDAEVHTRVLGREVYYCSGLRDAETRDLIPRYSTDPAASRKVIDEMVELGYSFVTMGPLDAGYWCQFMLRDNSDVCGKADDESLDMAICKAALAALAEEGGRD